MSRYVAPLGLVLVVALTFWVALHAGPDGVERVDEQADQRRSTQ